MPPRTRGATKREDTLQENNNGGKRIEKGGKVGKLRKAKDKARKPDANSERTIGNREIDTSMLDALRSNVSRLTEEDAQGAASSCTKTCETIYVGGRQDRSPSSPTREAESIHVAGYEVDVNPLLGENEIADRQVNPAMLDAQDGGSGSNGITSPTGTMEGVECGNGEANPLICRAGPSNHTEGDTPVQNTIAGTAEAVDQIEANTSAWTGTVTGNTSLPDSCDEQDQQEIGGTSNIKMKNTIYSHSGSMTVNGSNMNQATNSPFGSLTINLLGDTNKMGKRSRETPNDSSSPKLRSGDESPTRKRRRVGSDLKEDSAPTNCNDERNIAELHGKGVSCGGNTGTSKAEMDKLKSNINAPEVSSDGEGLIVFSKAGTNSGQSNKESHGIDIMGAVEGASPEAHTDRQDSNSDIRESGSGTDVDMACTVDIAGIGPKEPEVDGMDSSGEVNPRPCEVEKGIPISESRVPGVRSDSEVSRHPEVKFNYRQSGKVLQEVNNLDSADYSSSSTRTNKQNCDSNMPEMGIDIKAHTANHGEKPNDEQTNFDFGVMESSGSMETAPMNSDTERQNRDSDQHEEQRNADCNDEKLVSDVDSPSQSQAQKKDPIDVHTDVAQSPHSAQMGCPREPVSPLKERDSVMKYTGISPDDNLRRVELERSCVEKLEMKNAPLLIDMIDSLSSGKADTYYLLAFKMVLLIFPNKSWDHVRDKLPAMMGYATENNEEAFSY